MKKSSWKKTAAVVLAGVMSAGMLSGCGEAKLDGTKTVATVDNTNIPMGVLSLAVRTRQASMEAMYSYYIQLGYMSSLWDQTVDEEGKETYGQQMVSSVLEELEEWYLLRDHAADYGVELTADQEKAIADAAAKFMADNTEEALAQLAVSEDQVKEYLELTTYHEKMQPAIEAEADTEVSDEEAQQSSFTYVLIPLDEEEEEADAEAEDTEADATAEDTDAVEANADAEADTAAAETEASDADAATEEAAAETEANADAATEEAAADTEADTKDPKTKADELLAAMQADPTADMTTAAQAIDGSLYSSTGSFDANVAESTDEEEEEETSYSSYPDELIAALRERKDGEVLPEVLETENGYYVARLDKVFDEDQTESKKDEIISERQSAHYTEVVDGWKEAVKITTNDKVLAALKLTDSHTFTLKQEEAAEDEADAGEEAAEDETAADTEAETADEAETTDAAETSEETAETEPAAEDETAETETADAEN